MSLPPAPPTDCAIQENEIITRGDAAFQVFGRLFMQHNIRDVQAAARFFVNAIKTTDFGRAFFDGCNERARQMREHKKRARAEVVPVFYVVIESFAGHAVIGTSAVNYFLRDTVQKSSAAALVLGEDKTHTAWLVGFRGAFGNPFFRWNPERK